MGHDVRLLHPGDVARYRDGNKTDRPDAKAVLEAARNTAIDPVPVKSREEQAIATLHRLRQGYMQTRTARINAVRGHLREFGIVIPVGARHVVARAESALEAEELPHFLRNALRGVLDEIERLQANPDRLRSELEQLAGAMPQATVLMSVPGVGVLTATALIAFVGDLNRFRSGRELAAFLGLTPREHSSGHNRRLGRITKRGNSYLRMMLIHGARSALRAGSTADVPDDLRTWALGIAQRRGFNIASHSPTNSPASAGEYRATRDPLNDGRPPRSQSSCTAKTPMAHRSDRRGDAPITNVSSSGTGN